MQEYDKHILLAKWAEGTLTDSEKAYLSDIENLDSLNDYLKRLDNLEFPKIDEEAIYKKILEKQNELKRKSEFSISLWIKAVAAVLILGGISFWWFSSKPTIVIADIGEKKQILLPDKSEVVLNAETELKYYDKKWNRMRQVSLKGEAFFKVTKGSPFLVETSQGLVKVLGTQFRVYNRKELFEVVCYEGKVEVSSRIAGYKEIIQKGEGISFYKGSHHSIKELKEAPEWLNGISFFSKKPLSGVFEEMERQYKIELVFFDVNLQRLFSGEFPHNDLEGALERVCDAMNLDFEIKQNGKTIEIRNNNQ